MATNPLLKLVEVSKNYDSLDTAQPVQVLEKISLDVNRGESVAIIGPSGSGKSTLLNIIGTLDRPSSGQVALDDQDLNRLNEEQLAHVRNQQIGFIFQSHHLLPQCTVLENVLVPTLPNHDRQVRRAATERGHRLLERVGLGGRLSFRPGQLSGGERQRVAVVRALINQPKLVLADEPTGSLDHASAFDLGKLLVDLNHEQQVTLIVVTHSMELAGRMEKIFKLGDGKLVVQKSDAPNAQA